MRSLNGDRFGPTLGTRSRSRLLSEWLANGMSPLAWVISQNLKRRHLDASEKAAITVKALPMFQAEAKDRQRHHGGTPAGKNTSRNTVGSDSGEAAKQAAKATGAGITCGTADREYYWGRQFFLFICLRSSRTAGRSCFIAL